MTMFDNDRVSDALKETAEAWIVFALNLFLLASKSWVPAGWMESLGWNINLYQLSVVLVSLVTFMLAGAMAVKLLGLKGSWLTRLPTIMAVSIGLWSIPGLFVAFTVNFDLQFLQLWGWIITATLVVAVFIRSLFVPDLPMAGPEFIHESPEGSHDKLLIGLSVLVLIGVTWLSLNGPVSLDDNLQLGYVQDDLVVDRINEDEPALGANIPPNTRGSLTTWPINLAAIVAPTGLPAQQAYWLLRTPIVLLDLLALYLLVIALFGRRKLAIITVLLFTLIAVIETQESSAIGFGLFGRTAQDKFVVRYLLFPTTLAWCVTYLKVPNWRTFGLTGLMIIGLSATHPTGMVLLGITLAGLGIIHVLTEVNVPTADTSDAGGSWLKDWLDRGRELVRVNWPMVRPYVYLALLSATGLILPLVQQASPDAPVVAYTLTDTDDPSLWFRVNLALNNFRLLVANNLGARSYIVHPRVFLKAIIILPYLIIPFMLRRSRHKLAGEMMLGVFLLNPLILLLPSVVQFIGDRATPWLLYRFAWPLTLLGPIVIAWALWQVVSWASMNIQSSAIRRALPTVSVLLLAVVFSGEAYAGIRALQDIRKDPTASRCRTLQPLLSELPSMVGDGTVILSTPEMNMCIPSSVANGYPIEYFLTSTLVRFPASRLSEAEQRLTDVYDFRVSEVVDESFMDILTRWQVGLILVRADHPIVSQLDHLPGFFQLEMSREGYVIYRVLPGIGTNVLSDVPVQDRWHQVEWQGDHPIIEANSMWAEGDWRQAIEGYQLIVDSEADSSFLAYMGLGRAHLADGRGEQARLNFETAAMLDRSDPEAWAQLGITNGLIGADREAVRAWSQALEALEWHPEALNRLGDAYLALGQNKDAQASYQAAAASETSPGSSSYYRNLGVTLLSANLLPEAAEAFEASVSVMPSVEVYSLLSETHRRMGDVDKALEAARDGRREEIWSDLPYLAFAQLAIDQGDYAEGARNLRIAVRLHPRSEGIPQLTGLLRKVQGPEAALAELQRMIGFKLGFSDSLLAAAEQEIVHGRITDALGYARLAWEWEPVNSNAAILAGDIFRHIGLADQAQAYYQDALKVNRTSYNAYLGMAALARSAGQWGSARGWAWRAATAAPYSGDPFIALGDVHAAEGQLANAERAYRRAISLNPHQSTTHVALAEFSIARGEFTQASNTLADALAADPNDARAYRLLGSIYAQQGNLTEAVSTFDEGLRRAPAEGANYIAKANMLAELGHQQAAYDLLLQGSQLDPGNRPGQTALADYYLRRGELELAEDVFTKLIKQAPEFEDGYVGLGKIRERQGRLEEALQWYQEALRLVADPMTTDTQVALGDLYQRQARWTEARESYQSAIDDQPLLPTGYIALASLEMNRGNYAAASRVMQDAKRILPSSPVVTSQLASTYAAQGDIQRAEEVYLEAIRESPASSELALQLADFYLSLGRPQEARKAIEAFAKATPGNAAIAVKFAEVQIASGQPEQALETAGSLLRQSPGISMGWLSLAQALEASGNQESARLSYQRSVESAPGEVRNLNAFGQFLVSQGELDEAEDYFNQAKSSDIRSIDSYMGLATIAIRHAEFEQAADQLRVAQQQVPSSASPLLALGQLYQQQGQLALAEEHYQQAVDVEPTRADTYQSLAELFLMRADESNAQRLLEASVIVDPASCAARQHYGRYLLNIGAIAEGQQQLEEAVKLPGCRTSPYVDLGNLASSQGKPDVAIENYQKAIDAFPSQPLSYAALINFYRLQGDIEKSEELYKRASAQIPGSSLIQIERTRDLLNSGQLYEALATAERGVELAAGDPAMWINRGNVHLLLADYQSAANDYLSAARADSSSSLPWISMGRLDQRRGRGDEATDSYLRAIDIDPTNPDGYVALGEYYASQRIYDQAMNWLQQGELADQREVDASVALADLYRQRGQAAEARDILEQLLADAPAVTTQYEDPDRIQTDPEAPQGRLDVLLMLGDIHRSSSQWAEAEATFSRAANGTPGSPLPKLELAKTYQMQGMMSQAHNQIQSAIATMPGYSDSYVALGDWHRSNGVAIDMVGSKEDPAGDFSTAEIVDWNSASDAYQKALEIRPSDVEARLKLAEVHLANANIEEAERQLRRAVEVAPASAVAQVGLSRRHLSQGWLARSEAELKQSIEMQPSDPNSYVTLGNLYLRQGKSRDAKAVYEEAISRIPTSVEAYIALGDWYAMHGEQEAAEKHYRESIEVGQSPIRAYLRIASLHMSQDLPGQAYLEIENALQLAPANENANVSLGNWHRSYAGPEQMEEATQLVESELASASDKLLRILNDAIVNLEAGKIETAFDNFEEAIDEDPDSLLPYLAMGEHFHLIKSQSAAEESYRRAMSFGAGNVEGLLELGTLYGMQGRNNKADSSYQSAVVTFPGLANSHIAMGDWLREEGLHDEAIASYQRAIQLSPGEVEGYMRLADLYFLRGNRSEAYGLLAEAARYGLSPEAVACGPGELPETPLNSSIGLTLSESRGVEVERCRWSQRPW